MAPRTALLTALALLAAGTLAAQAQQRATDPASWTKHTFADDRFEVEFPGQVKSESVKLDPQTRKKIVRSTQHMQSDGDLLLIVGAQQNVDAVNFEGGSRSSFATLKCKTTQPEADIPIEGGKGREFKGSGCVDGLLRAEARYFEHGKWFYQVIAVFAPEGSDEPAARRFLASFRILK